MASQAEEPVATQGLNREHVGGKAEIEAAVAADTTRAADTHNTFYFNLLVCAVRTVVTEQVNNLPFWAI